MNEIWSKHVQGIRTLYDSRRLRFGDRFARQYRELFDLERDRKLRILEIGCGPGALAETLLRWYPNAEITAIDRDSAFLDYAKKKIPGVRFLEADAAALPFADQSFDVTISHTVSEHVAPEGFYGEQQRVLRRGGVCLVLSSRKTIRSQTEYAEPSDEEKAFWARVAEHDTTMARYEVGKYARNESELAAVMETYGFSSVRTGYVAVDLTPDDPKNSRDEAIEMINASRRAECEAVDSARDTMPELVTQEEAEAIKRQIRARYDARLRDYETGKKHWDTEVSVIMTVRGVRT